MPCHNKLAKALTQTLAPLSASFVKKVLMQHGIQCEFGEFDQISTRNSFMILTMVGRSQLSLCDFANNTLLIANEAPPPPKRNCLSTSLFMMLVQSERLNALTISRVYIP